MAEKSVDERLAKVNETLNNTLVELKNTKAELERVSNLANEYAKQASGYRTALLLLAKEINM